MSSPYAQHNEQNKANFDHVYDLPDPRGDFEALGSLGYRAPSTAAASSRPCRKGSWPGMVRTASSTSATPTA